MPRIIDVKRFKNAREHFNLTQQELAVRGGVTKARIGQLIKIGTRRAQQALSTRQQEFAS